MPLKPEIKKAYMRAYRAKPENLARAREVKRAWVAKIPIEVRRAYMRAWYRKAKRNGRPGK